MVVIFTLAFAVGATWMLWRLARWANHIDKQPHHGFPTIADLDGSHDVIPLTAEEKKRFDDIAALEDPDGLAGDAS